MQINLLKNNKKKLFSLNIYEEVFRYLFGNIIIENQLVILP
jgi:hypothetical protein